MVWKCVIKGGFPMVGPIQFSGGSKVYFRGDDDIINAPGKFAETAAEQGPKEDTVEISSKAEETENGGSTGKTIAKVVGGAIAIAAALWGLHAWKGNEWIIKEGEQASKDINLGDKIKNALVKPGEWLDNKIVKPITKKVRGKKAEGETKPEGETPAAKPEGEATGATEAPKAEGTTAAPEGNAAEAPKE